MMKKFTSNRILGALLLGCVALTEVRAQSRDASPYLWENNLIPPSPEAAGLSKLDLNPSVSATGRAPMNIPLYTLAAAGMQIPVQLAYTGGNGIRVNEAASSVGLGWVLDAGGVISVAVHGKPDLRHQAFADHRSFHPR